VPDELDLLKRLGGELAEPDEASVARARALLEQRAAGLGPQRPSAPVRLGWGLAIAAVALLVGSGLGFGVGSSVTPSGSAQANVAGLGFIPADGWRVTQTASIGDSGVARAVASNVPLAAGDEARDVPAATLRTLPAKGIVIVARFFPRGDPLRDARFPLRTLPLHVAGAVPGNLPRPLSQTSLVPLRLRAAADGYNVDARIFVGGSLTPKLLAVVDQQLRRLVLAPTRITLVVRPTVIRSLSQLAIFGSVANGRAGEKVTIQFRACGLVPPQFRDTFETTTTAGGGFSVDPRLMYRGPRASGLFRAVSGDSVSAEVPLRHQAPVTLRIRGGGRFQAAVTAAVSFWRRYVVLQRYEPRRGVWVTVRRVVLTEQGYAGSSSTVPFLTAPFRPLVPRGSRIRVVVPLSQAKPCYVAGVSEERRA
jgi:hypothetical protein